MILDQYLLVASKADTGKIPSFKLKSVSTQDDATHPVYLKTSCKTLCVGSIHTYVNIVISNKQDQFKIGIDVARVVEHDSGG